MAVGAEWRTITHEYTFKLQFLEPASMRKRSAKSTRRDSAGANAWTLQHAVTRRHILRMPVPPPLDSSIEVLTTYFNAIGVSCVPGFYDDPSFLAEERRGRGLSLNHYARFVQQRHFDEAYLARARREIPIIAGEFHRAVKRNGRLGACIDASNPLSRILEREGFWNFVAIGGFEISLTATGPGKPIHFWAVDTNPKVGGGHAWVFAPPFSVIDITVQLQPYEPKDRAQLPEMVIAENVIPFTPAPDQLISPSVRRHLDHAGVAKSKYWKAINPAVELMLATFPSVLVRRIEGDYSYMMVAVTASDGPLEAITNMRYDGKTAAHVYAEAIVPHLESERRG